MMTELRRTFDFVIKTPPTAFLLKKFAKIDKGAVKGSTETVATLTNVLKRNWQKKNAYKRRRNCFG